MRQATLFRFIPDRHRITIADERALARYIDWHEGKSSESPQGVDIIHIRSIRTKLEGRERRRKERKKRHAR